MQLTILVLGSAMLVTARTRRDQSEDLRLESYESNEMYESKDRLIRNPIYEKDLYAVLNHVVKEKTDSNESKIPKKRALSALSRWKPLGNLGIRMKTIHRSSSRAPMISMVPEVNLISAETGEGVRPLGQPLRWGRKR